MNTSTTYIVSARKYRPQTFDTIIGQEHVTNTLKNAILTNKIAQAYLFFGPRGVGKTTCARVFAKTINCLNLQPDGEACNQCTSCKAFNSNASFNIYELDAASNNSVEDIRQLIDQVRYPPQLGKYKVYIIDEVHMLSTAAFNAFLKTLEEPPAYAKFILATTEKNKVLPTVLSRCQVFNFNRIKTQDIAKYLERIAARENHQYEPEAIRIIAQKADGGLRDACSIYDQMAALTQGNITTAAVIENLHVLDYDYFFQLTDAFVNQDIPAILLLIDKILNKGFDPHNVLMGLMDHLRYLLLAKDPQTITILDLSDSAKSAIIEQSKKCNERFLLNALSILNKADVNFKSSRHQRLHLEIHLLQVANLISTLAESEKKNKVENNPSTLQNVSTSEYYSQIYAKDIKIVKVSERPVLKEITVKTTASIKGITNISTNQQVISANADESIVDYKANSTPESNISTTSELSISSTPQNITTTILQEEDVEYKKTQTTQQLSNTKLPSKIEHSSLANNVNDPILSITEKRYNILLAKNPLLEELKRKLNLQFK